MKHRYVKKSEQKYASNTYDTHVQQSNFR